MHLAFAIFQEAGCIKAFGLSESVLARFIANVAANYHANPYHNLVRPRTHRRSLSNVKLWLCLQPGPVPVSIYAMHRPA